MATSSFDKHFVVTDPETIRQIRGDDRMTSELSAQVAQRASGYNILEFLDGMRACRDGKPHQMGMGESYDAGYGSQYELQEIVANMGLYK